MAANRTDNRNRDNANKKQECWALPRCLFMCPHIN